LWEILKDVLNIRNIFNKYDGLSSEEMLALKKIEEQKKTEENQNSKEIEKEEFIDD
jgi:hypothetical protein